jgi:hypothetical protein
MRIGKVTHDDRKGGRDECMSGEIFVDGIQRASSVHSTSRYAERGIEGVTTSDVWKKWWSWHEFSP